MMGIVSLVATMLKGALEILAPLFLAYKKGQSDIKEEQDEEEKEILKKQRDNNVVSIRDADEFWVRLRNRKK